MPEIWLILFHALFCRALWWSLTDWREDNRYPEDHYPEKAPRNPFPTFEVKPWHW